MKHVGGMSKVCRRKEEEVGCGGMRRMRQRRKLEEGQERWEKEEVDE